MCVSISNLLSLCSLHRDVLHAGLYRICTIEISVLSMADSVEHPGEMLGMFMYFLSHPMHRLLSPPAPVYCCSILHSQTLLFKDGTEAALFVCFFHSIDLSPPSLKATKRTGRHVQKTPVSALGLAVTTQIPGHLAIPVLPHAKHISELVLCLVAKEMSSSSPAQAQVIKGCDPFIYLWHILSALVVELLK